MLLWDSIIFFSIVQFLCGIFLVNFGNWRIIGFSSNEVCGVFVYRRSHFRDYHVQERKT